MKRYKEINDKIFEVITAPKEVERIIFAPYKAYDIFRAYRTTPSIEKINIWKKWRKWADDVNLNIWISSSNNFKYTIAFHGYYENKKIWGLITDQHQKVVIA